MKDAAEIIQARTEPEIGDARELFREYASSTGVDLCFQNFDAELKSLPGKYAEPKGRLYLFVHDGRTVACGALRPFGDEIAEMKRLYVRPEARRQGHGARLCEQLISAARVIGYKTMVLDTLRSMTAARALSQKCGFIEIEPYYPNPLPDVCYMRLQL